MKPLALVVALLASTVPLRSSQAAACLETRGAGRGPHVGDVDQPAGRLECFGVGFPWAFGFDRELAPELGPYTLVWPRGLYTSPRP